MENLNEYQGLRIINDTQQMTFTRRNRLEILYFYRCYLKLPNTITDEEILTLYFNEIIENENYKDEEGIYWIDTQDTPLLDTIMLYSSTLETEEIEEILNTFR